MADLNICRWCGDCDGDHDHPECPAYISPDEKLKAQQLRVACGELATKLRKHTSAMTPEQQRATLERLAAQFSQPGEALASAEQSASRRPEARALELWAMDVLDSECASEDGCLFECAHTGGDGPTPYLCTVEGIDTKAAKQKFWAAKPAAARIAAARALRAAHPELPEEPKGSEP
jgi:hypothetical protein